LGLLRDEQGRSQDATRAFLRSRELEVEAPRAPWALTADQLREVAASALGALPEEMRDLVQLENTFIADLPGVEVIVEGVDPRALLLLDAAHETTQLPGPDSTPQPELEALEAASNAAPSDHKAPHPNERPTRLFIYQRNVERVSTQAEALAPELTAALEREIRAAFFDDASEPPPRAAWERG
jgi:hypothetical protein